MRGMWSTIALVLVLAGLGAYIYFVDSKKPAAGEEARPRRRCSRSSADKINELRHHGSTARPRPGQEGLTAGR